MEPHFICVVSKMLCFNIWFCFQTSYLIAQSRKLFSKSGKREACRTMLVRHRPVLNGTPNHCTDHQIMQSPLLISTAVQYVYEMTCNTLTCVAVIFLKEHCSVSLWGSMCTELRRSRQTSYTCHQKYLVLVALVPEALAPGRRVCDLGLCQHIRLARLTISLGYSPN